MSGLSVRLKIATAIIAAALVSCSTTSYHASDPLICARSPNGGTAVLEGLGYWLAAALGWSLILGDDDSNGDGILTSEEEEDYDNRLAVGGLVSLATGIGGGLISYQNEVEQIRKACEERQAIERINQIEKSPAPSP